MKNTLMELKSEYEQFYGFEDKEEYCKGIKLAIDKLEALSQHSANVLVSGNEVLGVAVAFAEWIAEKGWTFWKGEWYEWCENGDRRLTSKQLYDEFKSAKATDR